MNGVNSLSELISRFRVDRRISPSSYQCHCPVHEDQTASLTISEKDGKYLLHCHAGCQTEDILSAVGLTFQDLHQNAEKTGGNWREYVEQQEKRSIEGIYHYHRISDGGYAFTKLRLTGKKICYGLLENNRFTYRLGGKPRKGFCAVYGNLKALEQAIADGKPVFIPEGEKDVDTLTRHGYTSITYGGASDWQQEFSELFQGAQVYILADNDEPGKKVACQIKSDLQGVAASAKIITPVTDTPKADITDYFETGHTNADFEALLQSDNDITGEGARKTVVLIKKAADVTPKEPEWLIPGYIPKYGITTIAGEGGTGKTSIWCSLVSSITTGRQSFLMGGQIPFESDPENVLVFSAEDSWSYVLRSRLEACGADLDRIGFLSPEDERFVDLNFNGDLLKGIIETYRPGVIVFDPLQAFVPENLKMGDRNAMRKCFSPLIGYGEQYKLTSIIIAHANKQSSVWGRKRIADSSDIWDASRSVLMVGTTAEDDVRYISHEKSNWGRLGSTVLFTLEDCVPTFKCYSTKKDKDFILADARERNIRPVVEDAKDFIIDTLEERKQVEVSELDELAKVSGFSKNAMRGAKEALKKEDTTHTWSTGYGKGKKFFMTLKATEKTNK